MGEQGHQVANRWLSEPFPWLNTHFQGIIPLIRMPKKIPPVLHEMLIRIPPSKHRDTEFRPAQLRLRDATIVPCAYVMPADHFLARCGTTTDGPDFIAIDDVEAIEECPYRLPADIATRVHNEGETGMGYCLFTVKYSDGTKTVFNAFSTGLDFVDYPPGKSPADVVDVIPHSGSIADIFGRSRSGRNFKWVIFQPS